MITLRPIVATDADPLYPLVAGTDVPDTLLWDGPESLAEFRQSIALRAEKVARGELHMFAIVTVDAPVGCISLRPDNDFRGELALWVGRGCQGLGYGTEAVRLAARYAFQRVALHKLDAPVFVGNVASRRIFEKNGFQLEGTVRRAVRKRGRFVDTWLLGLLREEARL
ncbi:MAG: acetyltransferase, family [bacterium]|nr:acetyltransferase, family [bacterium]